MRFSAAAICWLLLLPAVCCRAPLAAEVGGGKAAAATESGNRLIIRPAPNAPWNASLRDVEKVLRSAASELWLYFPERTLKPIHVEPKGGPIVLFRRGPEGEYLVRLNTGNTYWAQYSFQFAHEFCHILCNYADHDYANKWFEESVCETASLFALRGMAETWKTRPPYPNWRSYAPHLRKYADQRIAAVKLPADTTFASWYHSSAEELRKNACIREKNRVVAGVLLPLFEKKPEHWEAVGYLNLSRVDRPRSFQQYLEDWHEHCPKEHRPFVQRIAELFEIELSKES